MTETTAKKTKKSAPVAETVVKKPRAKKVVADDVVKKAPKAASSKVNKPLEAAPVKVVKPRKTAIKKISVTPEERYKMVAAAAYFHAEKRGFQPGNAVADWIAAEAEIDAMLSKK